MGTEKELNKALSDIYSDLEKLQNAREQVEFVTESSKSLTESTSILLQELREFSNQFGEENTSNISQLTNSLEEFESKINIISEKGNKSISDYIETFKSQIVDVIDQFSKQIAENEKNLTTINNLNNERISEKIGQFEKSAKELKINVEEEIKEIKSVTIDKVNKGVNEFSKQIAENEKNLSAINNLNSEKINEKIEQFEKTTKDLKVNAEQGIEDVKNISVNEISKTIQHIIDTNSKADKLIDIITNYDIPNSLESLNKKLKIQDKQNNSIKTLLFIVLGLLGIGGVSAIILIMKFL